MNSLNTVTMEIPMEDWLYVAAYFVFALLIVVIFSFFLSFLYQESTRRHCFKLLTNGFNGDVPFDESDIKLIFKKEAGANLSLYASFIECYLVYLHNGHFKDLNNPQSVQQILKSILEREQATQPYNGIQDNERRILSTIENAIQNDDNRVIIKDHLVNLSESIRQTENDYRKSKRMNAWTIPISILSLILSIIMAFSGSRLSKGDLEKLDQHYVSIMDEMFHNYLFVENDKIKFLQDSENE